MESNYQEDSKSTSDEETDRSEQNNDDSEGTGRSYECVFCKRGFTTAQALGGHMNIHRKDRAKTSRPIISSSSAPSVSSKAGAGDDMINYANLRSYQPIQSYPPHYNYSTAPDHQVHVNYPASTWNNQRPPYGTQQFDDVQNNPQHHLNLFEDDDWRRRSLSLQVGPTPHNRENTEDGSEEEDELDLELRLGHNP